MHTAESDVELAHRLADDAGAAILPHLRALPPVENKAAAGFDPVTIADRNAERAIRDRLAVERPEDGILGEEFPPVTGTSGRTWILDPIDGTRGFMAGLPTWGVLIALADAEGPSVGMMAQPFVGERFFASREAAFLSSRRGTEQLSTRRCPRLAEAVVACTSIDHFDAPMRERVQAMSGRVRMIRYGTDCYGYALLAAGHIDIVIETRLQPFDIAPFVPMVEAAGGALFDRAGARIGASVLQGYGGDGIAVGDPALADELVAVLS